MEDRTRSSPALGENGTFDLPVTREVLYCCATTSALHNVLDNFSKKEKIIFYLMLSLNRASVPVTTRNPISLIYISL